MSIRVPVLAVAASLALAGCATYDLSTPEGRAIYERDLAISQQGLAQSSAFLNQQTQAAQAQNGAWVAPQVAPVGQSNGTAIVYCRDLSGSVIACKQIR